MSELGTGPARTGKTMRQDAQKSRSQAVSRRFGGKPDARDLPVVKFKVEKLPMPDLPLGNRACCCRIGS
jgi:hypothetical protein